jgi:spermidine/putrescine transport system permease protein
MTRTSGPNTLTFIYWAFVAYLFLPLAMMTLMGFKDSQFIGFPINEWTPDWYYTALTDPTIRSTFIYSITIAVVSTVLSLFIGTWVALLLGPTRFWGKLAVFGLMCLPAVVPGVISAIALRIFIRLIGIEPGMGAIIFGHTIHNVPFVALLVMARLSSLRQSHLDAARDLGADNLITFLRITLPYLKPALVGGTVFCLLLSFDDFVRSFFLGGYQPTLPVLIFAELRSGMSPEINAIATVVLLLTALGGLWAERSMRRLNRS